MIIYYYDGSMLKVNTIEPQTSDIILCDGIYIVNMNDVDRIETA